LARGTKRGADDDLEQLIVAVLWLEVRHVVVRDLVRVSVDLGDERLKVGGKAGAAGGGVAHGRRALARSIEDSAQNTVAEDGVGVADHTTVYVRRGRKR
jgi:hypothetical protein